MSLYHEPEERRSRLVPILATVTALLAVAVAAIIVLYFTGILDHSQPKTAATVTPPVAPTTADIAAPSSDSDARTITPPSSGTTDVPKAVVSIAPPAQGEPPVKSTHGDWQVRCDTPAGAASEQCVLMQFVTAEDRDNVGLTVIILKTADKKAKIMRVLAPLGVLLPSGLGLKVDNADVGSVGFVRCLPNGCVAEVILEDALLQKLQSGKTATFIIFQTPEEGIGIPISLNGFGDGFAALP